MRTTACLLCLCVYVLAVRAYPDGAPITACAALLPNPAPALGHGTGPQTSASPYMITTSGTTLMSDGAATITVTVKDNSGSMLKGVLLKATDAMGDVTGEFLELPADFKPLVDCGVTHRSNADKTQLLVKWRATTGFYGDVTFRATVVRSKAMYWAGMMSSAVTVTSTTSTTSGASRAFSVVSLLTASGLGMCMLKAF